MSETNWKELTERYYAGRTTLAEEEQLRHYWRQSRTEPEARLTIFFERERRQKLSPPRTRRLKARFRRPSRRLSRWVSAAAAAAALLLGLWFWSAPNSVLPGGGGHFPLAEAETTTVDWSRYEITDPELAAAILENSLRQVADGLRAGGREMHDLSATARLGDPIE